MNASFHRGPRVTTLSGAQTSETYSPHIVRRKNPGGNAYRLMSILALQKSAAECRSKLDAQCSVNLPAQNFVDFARQSVRRKRLLDERRIFVQNSVVDNSIVRIT